jgi:thioredoxin-related protein
MNNTKLTIVLTLAWLLAGAPALQAAQKNEVFEESTITHVDFPDWFINNPFLELNQDLADARASGKQGLMVLYTTEGCSYCALFIEKSLGDPAIQAMIRKHFNAVGLEIFNDANMVGPDGKESTVKDFAKREGVMFSPTILFYDADGNRVLRITGYQAPARFKTSLSYVTGKHYQSESLADYAKRVTQQPARPIATAPLRDDPLFSKPPFLLQRNIIPAQEPLLVVFEKADCEECDVFHDKVLTDKQVRNSLKNFEVVRLDNTDNKTIVVKPDGNRTTPAAWYKEEGFSRTPAMLFVSEQGQAAIKTDNLVLQQRMMNCINYMNERAYTRGWTYQQFARSKAIERHMKKSEKSKTE